MRPRVAGLVSFALCLAAGVWTGRAFAAETTYIAAGSDATYALGLAPRTTRLVGQAALAALEDARRGGAAGGADPDADPTPSGAEASPDAAGALTWLTGLAPFGPATEKPPPMTTLLPTSTERIAVLRLRRSFRAGAEASRVRVLRLRVRYRDAIVARLNGVEIARRNLAGDAAPAGFAQRARGPEWETFYIDAQAAPLRVGDNLLELEVRPHAARAAPSLDLELIGAEAPRIVRGPIVQRVGATSATIVFETDAPVTGELRWGTAESSYTTRMGSALGLRHVFSLDDLPRDAAVHYQVATSEGASADFTFHTAPAPGQPVRFVVYGDVRSGHETHARVLAAIADEAPDFVLTSGDMVLRGSDEADWQRYFELAGALLARICVYPAIGNHDATPPGVRRLEDIFALPPAPEGRPEGAAWYGFDVADVHVAMLDSNRYDDAAQLAWLDADLAAARARGVRAIFAVCHHGPYSRGLHLGNDVAREKYVPVLEKYGTAVIFSGHDHLYQRGRVGNLTYVVSGGGGAELYKPRCGVPGKKACPGPRDGMQAIASEYHYVLVEVLRDEARLCPKRPDGTPIEACVSVKLR
jgi:hypothetical protein